MKAVRRHHCWVLLIALFSCLYTPAAHAASLTVADVEGVIARSVEEALARGVAANIAVTDRVGNVLGVFRMTGAPPEVIVRIKGVPSPNGLENIQDVFNGLGGAAANAPGSEYAAIAKAVTGAYLSSRGNAFTTRTASQIVQEHFNPGETFSPSGPLFGVQFSQLPCSDLSVRQASNAVVPGLVNATLGPKRSPLGLSADPGGIPLYKGTDLVGAVGIEADGLYTADLSVGDFDTDVDELIALAGQFGFEPPGDILGNRVFVEGKSFRYIDARTSQLLSNPANARTFAAINGAEGALLAATGYFAGVIIAGQEYGTAASGFAADPGATFDFVGSQVFVLFNAALANRFLPINSVNPLPGGGGLTAAEVTTIIGNALKVAFQARAQIRRPLPSHAQVTVSVVDLNGTILGVARTPDAPIFGTDVSLQKARTAAFFSGTTAGNYLTLYDSSGSALAGAVGGIAAGFNVLGVQLSQFLTRAQELLGAGALSDGTAFSDRSGGNLSRPFFPDGIDGRPNGPFSRPINVWSPFNTGLQLDSVIDNIAEHLTFTEGVTVDTDASCTFFPTTVAPLRRLANGFQIFPGSVPIYRNNQLIGGIGVSGDGIDQDDMIGFLGLHDAGVALATGVGNAPQGIRADNLAPSGSRLRYVQCPFKPFISENSRNVCSGK